MNDRQTHWKIHDFLYLLFQYKLQVINYLAAACFTMKAGLLECLSKYVYCLGPIVLLAPIIRSAAAAIATAVASFRHSNTCMYG